MTDRNSKQYIRKKIAVLGSTGSVGKQTLDVAEKSGAVVTALSASSSIKQLEEQDVYKRQILTCIHLLSFIPVFFSQNPVTPVLYVSK